MDGKRDGKKRRERNGWNERDGKRDGRKKTVRDRKRKREFVASQILNFMT